jgi:hypothetical protein
MHFEVLTEDRSGGIVVETLMKRLLSDVVPSFTISIRPHRGKGESPKNWYQQPVKNASGLLDLLPAKLRAYDRVYAGTEFILVVIMDSDTLSPDAVQLLLHSMCRKFAPSLPYVIGICVEETEAWLMADEQALLEAYPDADMPVFKEYIQDSVCGTWEKLCEVLLHEKAAGLIRIGYPAIGQYKQEWAQNISNCMDPKRNISPSFIRFSRELIYATLEFAIEGSRE